MVKPHIIHTIDLKFQPTLNKKLNITCNALAKAKGGSMIPERRLPRQKWVCAQNAAIRKQMRDTQRDVVVQSPPSSLARPVEKKTIVF